MRVTNLPALRLGVASLPEAFERVFGADMLRRIHGDSLALTPWSGGKRTVRFEIRLDGVPPEVRRIFCGQTMRVTCRQQTTVSASTISVRDKLRMHFVGRELFIVRPRFLLESLPDGDVVLTAEVENHAMLPPPLCNVVEAFMDASSRAQLERLGAACLALAL